MNIQGTSVYIWLSTVAWRHEKCEFNNSAFSAELITEIKFQDKTWFSLWMQHCLMVTPKQLWQGPHSHMRAWLFVQRLKQESSSRKVSTLIDFTLLKEIFDLLRNGLSTLSLQWTIRRTYYSTSLRRVEATHKTSTNISISFSTNVAHGRKCIISQNCKLE